MEKIIKFVSVDSGDGGGDYTARTGADYSYGIGAGYGGGNGYGTVSADGDGYGYSYIGGHDGIKSINGMAVYSIDGIPTIIKHIHSNCAKGFILQDDLTLKPCYVIKGHNLFSHGETLREAQAALESKIYANMGTGEAIKLFIETFNSKSKKYPAKEFYIWHNRLTGSCEMGRNQFAKERNIDIETAEYTVDEFIELCKNSYGGEVIKRLETRLQEEKMK